MAPYRNHLNMSRIPRGMSFMVPHLNIMSIPPGMSFMVPHLNIMGIPRGMSFMVPHLNIMSIPPGMSFMVPHLNIMSIPRGMSFMVPHLNIMSIPRGMSFMVPHLNIMSIPSGMSFMARRNFSCMSSILSFSFCFSSSDIVFHNLRVMCRMERLGWLFVYTGLCTSNTQNWYQSGVRTDGTQRCIHGIATRLSVISCDYLTFNV